MNISTINNLCRIPLLGQIPSCTIAIAVKYFSKDNLILIRFYFDGNQTERDVQIIAEVANEVYTSAIDSGKELNDVTVEWLDKKGFSYKELESLDGFVYARL